MARVAPADPTPAAPNDGYKWRVLITVVFGTFMSILNNTVINVALPTIQRVFQADIAAAQGVATYYALALGIVIPIAGWLADRYGIKRVYVGSLIAFTAASVLCSLAPSLDTLIAFRIIKGLGGGSLLPLGTALLFTAFPSEERGFALGIFGIPALFAPAVGPALGGYLVQYADWRYIFLINVPVGLVGIVIASRFLRERTNPRQSPFDLPGAILSAVGFGSLLYGLSNAATRGWTNPQVVPFLAVGVTTTLAFFLWQLRSDHPLLDVRLYQKPVYLLASALGWIAVVAFFGVAFLLPIYLQTLRGQTPFEAGLTLLPQAAAAVLSVPFTGRLYDRIGPRYVIAAGLIALSASTWGFVNLSETTPIWQIMALLAVRGFALGCVIQPTQATALSVVERDQLTRASSLTNVMRNVFQSFGLAILGTILQVQGSNGTGAANVSRASIVYSVSGYRAAYALAFALSLVGIVLALFLPSKIRRVPRAVPALEAKPAPESTSTASVQSSPTTGN